MKPEVQNAFRIPSSLSVEDIAEMVAAMKTDAKSATKRQRRLQNNGGLSESEHARRTTYNRKAARLRRLKKAQQSTA